MSESAAKKKRTKQIREGRRNPELQRLSWQGLHPVEKKTPTWKEKQEKENRKRRKEWDPGSGDSIFYFSWMA